MEKKLCKTCNTEKYLTEFNKKSCAKDGRQAMCRECNRLIHKNLDKDKKRQYSRNRNKKSKDSGKDKAQKIVARLIKAGKLIRPDRCPICGRYKFAEAHHEDYERAGDVIWACRDCHTDIHNENLSGKRLNNFKKEYNKIFKTGE